MKELLFVISISILLSSCYTSQIVGIKSYTAKTTDCVFENDTVKISYTFWGNHGSMHFEVFNKLEVPIFIDWKNSAFILNGVKKPYWKDQMSTVGVSSPVSSFGASKGSQAMAGTAIKEDRITSIPPHAKISKKQYTLYYRKNSNNNKNYKEPKENEYSYDNSPVKFRNYLAISTNEQFTNSNYVDNEFFVYKTIIVKQIQTNKFINCSAFYIGQGGRLEH